MMMCRKEKKRNLNCSILRDKAGLIKAKEVILSLKVFYMKIEQNHNISFSQVK